MPLGDETEPERLRRLRAVAHPVRLRILSLLTGSALSAAEVARELGITQANASYHLRRLADTGRVDVVGTEKVRGGVAKKYRYAKQTDTGPGRGGTAQRLRAGTGDRESLQLILAAAATELQRRAAHHRPRPELARDTVFSDLETWLDPQTWTEVVELVERASTLAHERAQPARSEGTVPVSFTAILFGLDEKAEGPA
jgi:DNA-binding transcriptional ArsR family regulator